MSFATVPATLATQSFLSYKALSWGGASAYAWNRLARPIFFVTMFALTGRFAGNPGAAEAYIIGMTAAAIPATILDGILPTFTTERNGGMLPFLFVSGVNRVVLQWARGVMHLVNSWASAGISLVFAAFVLKLDCSQLDWGTLAVSVATISWASTAFALFAANFSLLLRAWTDLSTLLQGLVIAFTGAVIPLTLLPEPAVTLSQALPMTAGLVAFRAAFAGAPLDAVADSVVREAALGLVYALLAGLIFASVERQAKRRGALDWEAQ
jgi:ABC-type polysaccharide/polyol phosphate export permease